MNTAVVNAITVNIQEKNDEKKIIFTVKTLKNYNF